MTREEEIKYASKDYINYLLDKQEYHNENYTEDDIRQAFEKGAKRAYNNPKSPWISVDDEMPYDYTELLINQDTTLPILTKTERWGYFVQYMYYSPTQGWRFTEGGGVEYWMPIPELPK